MKGDDIAERLLDFAVRVSKLIEALPATVTGRHVGGQLIKAATSAGAKYEEGRGAESRADFIHKLSVSWKEVRESGFWIRFVQRSNLVKPELLNGLVQEGVELSCILAASIRTARGGGDSAS